MKKLLLTSAIFLFTTSAFAGNCDEFLYNKTLPVTTEKVTLLCKQGFLIGYSPEKKSLLWVAERIDPSVTYGSFKRVPFHKDAALPANVQSSNSDFVGTGYDKGHMVPFEDMSYSSGSAYDSMSLTNIVPQNYQNNRGGWKALEMYARKLAVGGPIYVVSGPIFEGKTDYLNGSVPIPTKLFKVIINPGAKVSKTYILPNTPIQSHETTEYVFTRADVKAAGVDTNPNADLKDLK